MAPCWLHCLLLCLHVSTDLHAWRTAPGRLCFCFFLCGLLFFVLLFVCVFFSSVFCSALLLLFLFFWATGLCRLLFLLHLFVCFFRFTIPFPPAIYCCSRCHKLCNLLGKLRNHLEVCRGYTRTICQGDIALDLGTPSVGDRYALDLGLGFGISWLHGRIWGTGV